MRRIPFRCPYLYTIKRNESVNICSIYLQTYYMGKHNLKGFNKNKKDILSNMGNNIGRKIFKHIKFSLAKSNKIEKNFESIVFRNDDVSYDSDVEHFKEFCNVFHKYGFVQLHAITLYGRTNCSYIKNGIPAMYDSIDPEDIYNYEICKSVSVDYIGDNQELIDYLNSIPDKIGLHGLYHSDYSTMTYSQQEEDIKEGLRLLHELFPSKKIDTFIAPFNHTNADTYRVCEKYGLYVSELEGDHLEDMIARNRGPLEEGQVYRYHHHRFYPESTFYYYKLSIPILEEYLSKNSYTLNRATNRIAPSQAMLSAYVDFFGAHQWHKYAYKEFKHRKHAYYAYKYIENHVKKDAHILEVACGTGGMLYALNSKGYTSLSGYDLDEKAISVATHIAKDINADISFYVDDVIKPTYGNFYDVIVWVNGMYHLNNYTLDDFFYSHCRMLNDGGYFIFDMVDDAYNSVPLNEFATQDWDKRDGERRPSEYKIRLSSKEVSQIAKKHNAEVIKYYYIQDIIPRVVYVIRYRRPRICFLCDRPNWAHHNSAIELKKQLSDEYYIDIKYVIEKPKIRKKEYNSILVFFWGETIYKKYNFPVKKIIKQVSSHRWEDDPMYGPCSPSEFVQKYLSDAATVICPSQILYSLLGQYCENIFLCGKGYAPEILYYKNERQGEMKLCMVGNLKDPVKGVEDILKPASRGYMIDLANDIKHEELVEFYNAHDIYVVSSKHEADPLPLIESMACGCFPVTTAIGIAPELIRHKENGYIVPERTVDAFREAFKWCNENILYIREQGRKNADEIYDKRRWEVMAESYRNMLRNHLKRTL